MPTYKITITPVIGNLMIGERWHPSHDLEKVTALFTKQAIEAIGKSQFTKIEVVMVDDDYNHEIKPKPQPTKFVPTPRRKDLYGPGDPLKDRK